MSKALNKIIQARSDLILDPTAVGAFFGALAWRLVLTEDPTCKRFATDGKRLFFNPAVVEEMPLPQVVGAVCHEVMHVADGHNWRREWRDTKGWNIACDRAINPPILEAGLKLPGDVWNLPEDRGKSAEEIYGKMKPEEQKGEGKFGDGTDGPGEVRDCEEADSEEIKENWKVAVIQAAQVAAQKGKLPAGIERFIEAIRSPAVDWKAALRRFMETCAKNDFSWQYPNKRYIASGLYLPSLRSEQMPPIVLYWDTSGSMDDRESRAIIATECGMIISEVRPEKTHIVYGDAKVQHTQEFGPDEPVNFEPKGGGGTDFRPIFEWVTEQGIQPACFIGITDLEGYFPDVPPGYPVIWASTTKEKAPWGETIEVRL